jgi:hypothetical protein
MLLRFTDHALVNMDERDIGVADVEHVLTGGEIIETYPEDRPYPSRLVLGWSRGRPIHVVAADVPGSDLTIVVTTYVPDPDRWDPTFRMRRPRRP